MRRDHLNRPPDGPFPTKGKGHITEPSGREEDSEQPPSDQYLALAKHLTMNFKNTTENGVRRISLNDFQANTISIHLDAPEKTHRYRMKIDGETFDLSKSDFAQLLKQFRFVGLEKGDSVTAFYAGRDVRRGNQYNEGPGLLFDGLNRLIEGRTSRVRPEVSAKWDELFTKVPPSDIATKFSKISQPPEQLKVLAKNSIQVNSASGTIVATEDGSLVVVTARHVVQVNPLIASGTKVKMNIGGLEVTGKGYFAEDNHPTPFPSDDIAIIKLSPKVVEQLKSQGFTGVPTSQNLGNISRFDPVIALGFPGSAKGDLTVSTGNVFTHPHDDRRDKGITVQVQNYDGNKTALADSAQSLWTTTTPVSGGNSGGGLFGYNPAQNRFELVGIAMTGRAHTLRPATGRSPEHLSNGIFTQIDQNRLGELTRTAAPR